MTGSIIASQGYERIVDGKKIQGASVDWYGKLAESPQEYFQKESLTNRLCETDSIDQLIANVEQQHLAGSETAENELGTETSTEAPRLQLNGFWVWKNEPPAGQSADVRFGGTLLFTALSDGTLQGYSMNENSVNHPTAKKVGSILPLKDGTWRVDERGEVHLTFSVSGGDGLVLKNRVQLTRSQGKLRFARGTSVHDSASDQDSSHFEYSWRAWRLKR